MATAEPVQLALGELISTFNELNGSTVQELYEEPSPLEFMRFVSRNSPFVIRGGASSWKSTQCWDATYLSDVLRGHSINVAVTPKGNADSPTYSPEHRQTVLAKPHEELQPFDEFLQYIIRQENGSDPHSTPERDIPFARIALQKPPDAINLWIGNSHSVTAAHKDNFENIYVQVLGRKTFLLLPPLCHPCMNEKLLPSATYVRTDEGFSISLDQDAGPVPFATWDPDDPENNATPLSHLARPLRVTLEPGDMLYLPAMWYHKVTQSCPEEGEGFVVAINYWYDMEFGGTLYPLTAFLRTLAKGADV